MSLYISGAITNADPAKQAENIKRFHQAAAQLRARGYKVVNPCENSLPADAPWEQHMRADIKLLMDCAGVAMLPGMSTSKGALIEWQVARGIGMECRDVEWWLEVAA